MTREDYRRFWKRALRVLTRGRRAPAARSSKSRSDIGSWGEDQAVSWLRRHGFAILGRNVRPGRHGELDIVARMNDTIVFVEVKTRRDEYFGRPAAAVNPRQRQSLCRTAAAYLRRRGYPRQYYRFDIIEVLGQPGDPAPEIRHIEDAFRFPPRYRFPM